MNDDKSYTKVHDLKGLIHTSIEKGRVEMREEIVDILRGCLARDPTLQKIINEIEFKI